MYHLLLLGSAALTLKSYHAAQESNFILFLVFMFMSNIFTIIARRERGNN